MVGYPGRRYDERRKKELPIEWRGTARDELGVTAMTHSVLLRDTLFARARARACLCVYIYMSLALRSLFLSEAKALRLVDFRFAHLRDTRVSRVTARRRVGSTALMPKDSHGTSYDKMASSPRCCVAVALYSAGRTSSTLQRGGA